MFDARSRAEWIYQAPRWRTVLVLGRPTRLYWPHLAFYKESSLSAYALESPAESKNDLLGKLRYFPFTAFNKNGDVRDMSHIDYCGNVCFSSDALDLIVNNTRDVLDVFWNSGFSVFNAETLRAWRAATEEEVVALRPFPKQRLPADVHGYASRLQFSSAWWRLPGEARGDDALVAQAQDAAARGPDVAHGGPAVDPQGGALE